MTLSMLLADACDLLWLRAILLAAVNIFGEQVSAVTYGAVAVHYLSTAAPVILPDVAHTAFENRSLITHSLCSSTVIKA